MTMLAPASARPSTTALPMPLLPPVTMATLPLSVMSLFLAGPDGRRPCYGGVEQFQHDPAWQGQVLFNEYFHGDNGAGLGATHQTGWTGVVADLIRGRPGHGVYSVGDLQRVMHERLNPSRTARTDPQETS